MKTLTVSLADLEGQPHGSHHAATNVTVLARYTGPVTLADGTVIPAAIKSKQLPATGSVSFEVYASDDPLVHADWRGFAIVITAEGKGLRGERAWQVDRTVKVLESHTSPVALGSLEPAEGLPAGWMTVSEFNADIDARLDALEASGGGVEIQVGGPQPSSGWWLNTGSLQPVTASGPVWTDNPGGGGSWSTPIEVGVTYSPASGTATPDQTVTVTATADAGYVINGTTSWSHTFPAAPPPASEPTWATLLASDDFERANTSPTPGTLGAAPTGGTWNDPTPAFYIVDGRAVTTVTAFATLPAALDVKASAIAYFITNTTANTSVIARASAGSTATFYEARFASTHVRLYRFVDGVVTQLGDSHPVTLTVGTARAIALRVWESGGATELRVDLDGTQVITATDAGATRPMGTFAGIRGQTANVRFNSFTAHT